ncbi:MAG: DUF2388 domain-containing protein [Pseudomonas sp.]|uniref:DUF2388 domain-containing protein n=1 Tax=Pseudomonas sp. TaxID=306 RepID=UPI003BB72C30
MRSKLTLAALITLASLTLLVLPSSSAMADSGFWRDVISSGATTASTYLTFRKHDHKLIVAAQEDASSFIASGGTIRGPYLEAVMYQVRADHPDLQVSDQELAQAILVMEQ